MSDNGRTIQADQMAPHSAEAEEAVLGAVILNPLAIFEVPFLRFEDFFIVRNGWIWEAIRSLQDRSEEIDNVTVGEELRQQERLDEIGGAAYITYLINHTPSIHTETYGRIVERAAIRRRMLGAASEIAQLAHEESDSIDATIEKVQAAFFDAVAFRQRGQSASALAIGIEVYNEVEAAYVAHQRGESVGLPTGFTELEELIGGLHKHRLYIVAGRPGMGKTAWILTVMFTLAKAGIPIGLFSLEMNRVEVVRRMVSMETGISTRALENGRLSEEEFALFIEANDRIAQLPFFVNDTPANNIASLRSQAKAWYLEYGIKAVFVDYLQLAHGDQNRENRTLEVGSISRGLKHCARELEIPVIAAAQLNRGVENRADKRPGLSDLRESGDIENDADVVMFLYRDEYYNPNTERQNIAEVIIAKQRNGPTGIVDLYWKPKLTQFCDISDRETLDLRGYSPAGADNYIGRGAKD